MSSETNQEKPDLEELLELLQDAYYKAQRDGAYELINYYPGDERTFEPWLKMVETELANGEAEKEKYDFEDDEDPYSSILGYAAVALGYFHNERAFEALKSLLVVVSSDTRENAIEALAKYGEAAIPALLTQLGDEEDGIVVYALEKAFLEIGRVAFDALIEVVKNAEPGSASKVGATSCLAAFDKSYFNDPAYSGLFLNLFKNRQEKSEARANAAGLLEKNEAVVTTLMHTLADPNENSEVRGAVARRLGWLGVSEATELVVKATGDYSDEVRAGAIRYLYRLPVEKEVLTKILLQGLNDTDSQVNFSVNSAISDLGADWREFAPYIVQSLATEHAPWAFDNALRTLATFKDDGMAELLVQVLVYGKSSFGGLEWKIPEIIQNNKFEAIATPLLIDLLHYKQNSWNEIIKIAFDNQNTTDRGSDWVFAFENRILSRVIEVLGKIGDERALPALASLDISDFPYKGKQVKEAIEKIENRLKSKAQE